MGSIKQLQGMDYLLKKMVQHKAYKVYEKNLKLTVKINNELWYGDFVDFKSSYVVQKYIDHLGSVDVEYIDEKNKDSLLGLVLSKYTEYAEGLESLNPFMKVDDLGLLFYHLSKIAKLTDTTDDNTPLYPYLYNAHKIGTEIHLDFIDLTEEDVKAVSLIELK